MASILKRPRSPYWWAAFYREDGRRAQRSTRTTDPQEAHRIAHALEDAHQRRATAEQMRKILSSLHERLAGKPLHPVTLAGYAATWLERKKGEVKDLTWKVYQGAVDDFVAATPAKAQLPLPSVTAADIVAWRDRCAARTTAATANNKLKVLRAFFQTAWRDRLTAENVATQIGLLTVARSDRRPFTRAELGSILAVANPEWRGMILAGLSSGLRLKDIAALTWDRVHLQTNELHLPVNRSGLSRIIPVPPPLKTCLAGLAAAAPGATPVFPHAHLVSQRAGGSSALSQQFHGLLVAAGLATERPVDRQSRGIGRDAPRRVSDVSFASVRLAARSLLGDGGIPDPDLPQR